MDIVKFVAIETMVFRKLVWKIMYHATSKIRLRLASKDFAEKCQ